jgi:hypothetical protein
VVRAGSETTACFDVSASSDVQKVELSVAPAEGFHTRDAKSVKDLEGWRCAIGINESDSAGKGKATAVAFDAAGKEIAKDFLFLAVDVRKSVPDTRISRFSADPYKVRKGGSIQLSGRSQVDDHGWEGVRTEKVSVYYRADGSSGSKWSSPPRPSEAAGSPPRRGPTRAATFRAVYDGSDELDGSTSRTDHVRVYGSGWRR